MKALKSKWFVRSIGVLAIVGVVDVFVRIVQGIIWLINQL